MASVRYRTGIQDRWKRTLCSNSEFQRGTFSGNFDLSKARGSWEVLEEMEDKLSSQLLFAVNTCRNYERYERLISRGVMT